MHVLVAPDKFKGSLTAAEVAAHVSRRAAGRRAGRRGRAVPVADGGDGTLDAAVCAGLRPGAGPGRRTDGRPGRDRRTPCGADRGRRAGRRRAGLRRLPGGRPAPLTASSRGLGEVIGAALDAGCTPARRSGSAAAPAPTAAPGMVAALGAPVARRAPGRRSPTAAPPSPGSPGSTCPGCARRFARRRSCVAVRRRQPAARPARRGRGLRAAEGRRPRTTSRCSRRVGPTGPTVAVATGGHRPLGHPAAPPREPAPPAGSGSRAIAVLGATARPGIDLVLELIGFHDRLAGRRPGRHGGGVAGRADPARQGPRRCGRGGPPRRRTGRRRVRPQPAAAEQLPRRRDPARPTRSPTSSPTRSGAWPRPARCWNGSAPGSPRDWLTDPAAASPAAGGPSPDRGQDGDVTDLDLVLRAQRAVTAAGEVARCVAVTRRADRRHRAATSPDLARRAGSSSWPTTRCCCPGWSTPTSTSTSPGAPSGRASPPRPGPPPPAASPPSSTCR